MHKTLCKSQSEGAELGNVSLTGVSKCRGESYLEGVGAQARDAHIAGRPLGQPIARHF